MAHNNLAKILIQQGRLDEAIAQCREALQLYPNNEDARSSLGNALLQQGRLDEAIAQYREALRINPRFEFGHNNLGKALCLQGRVVEGIAQYREAIEINPRVGLFHYNLGNALLQQGRLPEAIAEYRQAVRINPDAEDQTNLGNALFQQGSAGEALFHVQEALDLDPANAAIQNDLAWMLATAPQPSLRNGPMAVHLAAKASRAAGGGNPLILRTLAAAYAQAGQFPEAVQTVQRALQLAQAQSDAALAGILKRESSLYEARQPYRQGE
jgi:tetratricopeptide (TPR) repeat protein